MLEMDFLPLPESSSNEGNKIMDLTSEQVENLIKSQVQNLREINPKDLSKPLSVHDYREKGFVQFEEDILLSKAILTFRSFDVPFQVLNELTM